MFERSVFIVMSVYVGMFNNMHVDGRKLSVDHDRAGDANEKF